MRIPVISIALFCLAVAACGLAGPGSLGSAQQALEPTPPAPDACAEGGDFKRCGPVGPMPMRPSGEAMLAPAGCSCEPDCGYKGNCCRDAVAACSDDPETGWFYMDADTFSTYSPDVSASIRMDPITPATARWVAPMTDALVGMTRAVYAGLADGTTQTTCRLLAGASQWMLVAEGENEGSSDDASAQCGGRAIRAKNLQHAGTTVAATSGSNRLDVQLIGPVTANSAALLGGATFSDTDGAEPAMCEVFELNGNRYLKAEARNDADASCTANLWDLGGTPNAVLSGTYQVSVTAGTLTPHGNGVAEAEMAREGDYACFLTKVSITDAKSSAETAGCSILARNGMWRLRAQASPTTSACAGMPNGVSCPGGYCANFQCTSGAMTGDSEAECHATCFQITGNPYPPTPAQITSTTDGSELVLYQDGAYDRPTAFVEGFDPENRYSTVHYTKEMAIAFRSLQRVGFDIWMLDLKDGGGDLGTNAIPVIQLIEAAHAHAAWANTHPGKKFPLLGVSMGGILTRTALAAWEQVRSDDPPISAWVTLAGTHYGAQIPHSAQTALQNLGAGISTVKSMEAYRALNSVASRQMLTESVSDCDAELLWQWCGLPPTGLGRNLLRSGTYEVRGTSVYQRIPGSWPYAYNYEGSCELDSTEHMDTYDAINALGTLPYGGTARNGWPQTVSLKVGLANGSWSTQSCDRLPDGIVCNPNVLGPNGELIPDATVLGTIDFESPGQFGFCDFTSEVFLLDQASDSWPGDLSGRSLSSLNVVALKSGADFGFKQLHPFLHHRTDYDLACPLTDPGANPASHDRACRAANRTKQRFDYVHSNPDVNSAGLAYNGSHDTVSAPLGEWLLAYMYDARPEGDADGWFTECADPQAPDATCNPFFRRCHDPEAPGAGKNPFCHPSINGTEEDCDESVHMLNNQCAPAGSCVGRCGGPSMGCSCDAWCTQNGDCCPDFVAACGDGGNYASCAGSCGVASLTLGAKSCSCASTTNCCPDKVRLCGVCNDGVTNGSESDVDCGGPECAPCANQAHCSVSADCASGRCAGGLCVPWSRALGGAQFDAYYAALDAAFDPSGNLLVTTLLQGPAEVGDTTPAPAVGNFDLFVGKYGPDGTHLWSKLVGGQGQDVGFGIASDFDGNVFVGGKLGYGGSVGGGYLNSGNEQALVAKYSPSGEHLWSKAFGSPGADDSVRKLETLRTGEVVVAGMFWDPIDFGLGPLSGQGGHDVFVAKLRSDGSPVWAKGFGGASHDVVTDLAVNAAGEVVLTGMLVGPVDFGGGLLSPVGQQDMFVLKLSPSGEHEWSAAFGGNASSITSSHAVALSDDGEVFLTGSFFGTLTFGGPTFSSWSDDVFLAKLHADGTLGWSRAFVGDGFDAAHSIVLDGRGHVVVAGAFNANILELGGAPLHVHQVHSPGFPFGSDVFLAKYDASSGEHLYSTSYPSSGDDRALVVVTRPLTEETVLAGVFTDALDMGGGVMTSAGSFDVFLTSVGIVP